MEKPFNAQLLLERINEAFRLDSARRLQKAEQERILRCMAQLTHREREVMDLIVSGKSNKEIAYTLRISRKTYELHRARVMEKMQVTNAVELAQKAMRCTPWTRQKIAGNKVVNPA
jgi:FixJ family two-component response regulator